MSLESMDRYQFFRDIAMETGKKWNLSPRATEMILAFLLSPYVGEISIKDNVHHIMNEKTVNELLSTGCFISDEKGVRLIRVLFDTVLCCNDMIDETEYAV